MLPQKKIVEEDAQPEFAQMPLYQISKEGWVEMEKNRQNLTDARLYASMKVVFESQNDHRLRAFLKRSSCRDMDRRKYFLKVFKSDKITLK